MIKINLLRNQGRPSTQAYGTGNTTFESSQVFDSQSSGNGQSVLKLLVIVLFPAALWYWEQDNLTTLRNQAQRLNKELNTVQTELNAKSSVAEALKQYTTEKAKLESQIEVVRQLNKVRLVDIRALDAIQTMIPPRVWLSRVNIDQKGMTILGYALTSDEISTFIKSLESSVFFSEVLLTSSIEEQSRKGTFKKFEVKCGVGATDG